MIEQLFAAIVSLGSSGAQNLLTSVGENVGKKFKESYVWKKLLVDTGEFFIKNEQEEKLFFNDLEIVLSKENLSEIAKDIKTEDGYDISVRINNVQKYNQLIAAMLDGIYGCQLVMKREFSFGIPAKDVTTVSDLNINPQLYFTGKETSTINGKEFSRINLSIKN